MVGGRRSVGDCEFEDETDDVFPGRVGAAVGWQMAVWPRPAGLAPRAY